MTNQITKTNGVDTLEQVLMTGNLAALTPEQRVTYYNRVCESVGLNPLTRPFDYLTLNGKLILYARKDATEQLRKIHGVSIESVNPIITDDMVTVTVGARTADGRTDFDLGVVTLTSLKGEAKANAIMKAITKGKRRVTLSICGLGWLDETEVDTIPEARTGGVDLDTGEVIDHQRKPVAREQVDQGEQPAATKKPATKAKVEQGGPLQWMIDEGYAENVFNAAEIANLLEFGKTPDRDDQRELVALYRSWRAHDAAPKVAATHALAGNLPEVEPTE